MSDRGPAARMTAVVGAAAAALRRRRLAREPRVRLHEPGGVRTLSPEDPQARALVAAAGELIAAVSKREPEPDCGPEPQAEAEREPDGSAE